MEKLELADKIYAYIERNDLCRGSYVESNGAACLLGAGRLIQLGPEEEWFRGNIAKADYATAAALGFDSPIGVIVWNDDHTKGEAMERIGDYAQKWLGERLREGSAQLEEV